MKLPLKYIAIFVIVALVGVFSYQAYWLVGLYQSQKEEMDEKVNLALNYAHIMELSHREAEILRFLVDNQNKVVETNTILLELWGDDSFFNTRSLHVFITKLRHKLSDDEHIRIVNVRGIGYKLIL